MRGPLGLQTLVSFSPVDHCQASQWEWRFSTGAGHACLRGSLPLRWQPPSGAMKSFRVSYLVQRGLTALSGVQKHNFHSCQTAILNGTLTAQRGAATQSSYTPATAVRIDMLATAERTSQRHRHNGKKTPVGKTFGSRAHCCCHHFLSLERTVHARVKF